MGNFCSILPRRISPLELTDVNQSKISLWNESNTSISQTLPNATNNNTFIVIWLDADADDSDFMYQKSLFRLQRIFVPFHTFTDIEECVKLLYTIKHQIIVMVISDDFYQKMLPRIKSTPEICSVYILSHSGETKNIPNQDYYKINGVFTRVEPICSSLKRNTTNFKPDSLIMSIIPSMKYSKKDLHQVNQLFIYWMLVKQIIFETKYDHEAIKEFAKFSRSQYYGNNDELKNIDEFKRNYLQHSPIWWYTREHFVFDMLNRAFQTQDIEIIIRMAFFIKDLHQHLEKLQIDMLKTNKFPIVVYRSQNVSNEDFEKMKNIQGSILAFNNFIMADQDYNTSLNLARRVQNNNAGIGIIFCMKINSRQPTSPYAFLNNVSYSSATEQCLLFSMNSLFRMVGVKQIEDRVWEVHLTLSQSNDEQIVSLEEVLRHETQQSTSWFKLAQLMTIIRDYDHAKDIYFALLELLSDDDELKMAHIYNELGILEDEIGDFTSAFSFYEKALEIRKEYLPSNHRSLSISYNNMGEVQRQMGDYFSALLTHQKTLDIKRKSLSPNDPSFATTYNNIGLTSELLGEFSTALDFYQRAIEIKLKTLPPDHEELATTYNNMGELQRAMGYFPAALTNLEKALSIRLKNVPPTDSSLAIIYNNIGLIHIELGHFPKGMSYLEKSLDVKLKHFPSNHPSLAFSYNNIGGIYQQMGQFSQALASYQKALDIQEQTLPPNHPEIAVTYTNIGVAYQAMANYSMAHLHYKKALTIREKSFPPNHPLLGVSYNNLGHLHQLMGEYKPALEYYEKALKLQQNSLSSTHPALAATYNNIADIQRKLNDHKKALAFYKKSLDIKKKSLPPNHPAFVITYNNMGALHQSLKNYTDALVCYKQTLDIQRKNLPPDHPDVAAIYNNMGVSHQSLQEYSIALDYYKKALEIQNKVLPPTHPDIATTYNSMATVLVSLGDFEGALENEKHAVDIASRTLTPDHPNLLTFKNYYERISAKVESMK